MKQVLLACLLVVFGAVAGVSGVVLWQKTQTPQPLFLPDPTPTPEPERPLLRYSFDQLQPPTAATAIALDQEPLIEEDSYSAYTYTSSPLDRTMTGVVNLPAEVTSSTSAILMLRGWVPATAYAPGTGTKNVAAAFAQAGLITIAPDFFGYGKSDPEPTDEWQARFEKPLVAATLIRTLQQEGVRLPDGRMVKPARVGIWGHSNGGQIALSTLVILQEPIPTALWAPVTAPFPYSLLYFTDEEPDEGQRSRKWISLFETLYDARQFSFTNYLSRLRGPLQLQQGTNDDAVLKWWSDEFIGKLQAENRRREQLAATMSAQVATTSGTNTSPIATDSAWLEPISYEYFVYQGADHNLRPDWDTAVARDLAFFTRVFQEEY